MLPIWLSAPMRVPMSNVVSCAEEVDGNAKSAVELTKSIHFCNLVRIVRPFLEVEIKSHQYFAGVEVGQHPGVKTWSRTVLVQPVVLVVPSQTGAARHERVVAEADGIGRDISQVGRHGACKPVRRS